MIAHPICDGVTVANRNSLAAVQVGYSSGFRRTDRYTPVPVSAPLRYNFHGLHAFEDPTGADGAYRRSRYNLRPASRWRSFTHSVGWMVLVAFLVRVAWIILAHTYRLRTSEDNWGFGWEIGRLGYSLATGHGFSSPFGGDTGPSAWTAPIYPWFVSVAFRLFGNYSRAAAFWLLVFNSAFAALTCWTIYRTARRVFNETVAVWSGWIWALASLHYLLVGARDLGDQRVGVPGEPALHADGGDGRRRAALVVDWLRFAVGSCGAHQSRQRCRSCRSRAAGWSISCTAAGSDGSRQPCLAPSFSG